MQPTDGPRNWHGPTAAMVLECASANVCSIQLTSGMKGTQNNFLSRQDCERTCYVLDNPVRDALGPPQMGLDNRPVTCSIGMNTCGAGYWCHFGANQQPRCCPGTRDVYGLSNNFLTQQECEQTCPVYVNVCPVGTPLLDSTNHPVPCTFGANSCGEGYWCHLGLVPDEYQCCPGEPTVPGACQGLPEVQGELGAPAPPATRYYYSVIEMACKPFIYNGRKGNQNNFLTLEDCEETCNGESA
ncbi:Kunitz/Bovine pancreatic trypsin inhibitor domain protein [Cooperia oncophora]